MNKTADAPPTAPLTTEVYKSPVTLIGDKRPVTSMPTPAPTAPEVKETHCLSLAVHVMPHSNGLSSTFSQLIQHSGPAPT